MSIPQKVKQIKEKQRKEKELEKGLDTNGLDPRTNACDVYVLRLAWVSKLWGVFQNLAT